MFIYNEHKFLYTSNTSQNVNKWNRCCVVVRGLRGTELLIAQTLICLQLFTFTRNYQIILWTSYVFGVKRQRSFENFVPLLKKISVWIYTMGAKDKTPAAVKTKPVFTKEEELLLQDFSRNVSTKSNALFYGNAFIVSAIPICEYWFWISQGFEWCDVWQLKEC